MFKFLFKIITTTGFLLVFIPYAIIRKLQGKSLEGFIEKFGHFKTPNGIGEGKTIMYHGVSVGEVIALENLIKETRRNFEDYKIVITTGTPTGQDIAKKKYGDIANFITYFPFDAGFCVRSFLNKIKPSVIMIAETEIWPNFILNAQKYNIPLYIINGRISDASFKSYKYFKFFFSIFLNKFKGIYTQSEEDREKYIKTGASPDKTFVMKNLKFDIKKSNKEINIDTAGKKIIIAGSTHKGENEIIIDAYIKIKEKNNNTGLIIAPRHLNRIQSIEAYLVKKGIKYGFKSKNDSFKNYDVIILDTLGELSCAYSICDIAFIGGSFNNTGGHNPLEAIIYNKPVLSGPSVKNFKDIYHILTKAKAGFIVKNCEELIAYLEKLLSDNDFYNESTAYCKKVFEEQQGAKDFVINKLKELLK